jgi:hypothetical protein
MRSPLICFPEWRGGEQIASGMIVWGRQYIVRGSGRQQVVLTAGGFTVWDRSSLAKKTRSISGAMDRFGRLRESVRWLSTGWTNAVVVRGEFEAVQRNA